MNRPLMNTLWLLGCKTILSAPIWYSLGVMIVLPQQRNALLLLTSWGIAGCCEHFASSISPALPAAPSSAGFNNILNARNTHRTLLCHWNLQMWKYHRTWARDWIQYDWWLVWIELLQVVHLKEQLGCGQVCVLWQGCDLTQPRLASGMECWPVPQEQCVLAVLGQKVRAQPVRIHLTLSGAGYRWSPAGGSVELVGCGWFSSGVGTQPKIQ